MQRSSRWAIRVFVDQYTILSNATAGVLSAVEAQVEPGSP